jgi:hypothetical protein
MDPAWLSVDGDDCAGQVSTAPDDRYWYPLPVRWARHVEAMGVPGYMYGT